MAFNNFRSSITLQTVTEARSSMVLNSLTSGFVIAITTKLNSKSLEGVPVEIQRVYYLLKFRHQACARR